MKIECLAAEFSVSWFCTGAGKTSMVLIGKSPYKNTSNRIKFMKCLFHLTQLCLLYDICMYNTAKHLMFLNFPISEPLDRQWTNGPSDADFPWCYMSLFSLSLQLQRTGICCVRYTLLYAYVWDTSLVHLSKFREAYPPLYEIQWGQYFTSGELFHGSKNSPTIVAFFLNNLKMIN